MKYSKSIFSFVTLFTLATLVLPTLASAVESQPTLGADGYYEKMDIETPGEQALRLYGEELSPKLIEKVLKKPMSELDPKMFLSEKPLLSNGKPILFRGGGDGNTLDFDLFRAGDMVVARDSSCSFFIVACYWSHAATFDSDYYTRSESDYALWSAYPTGAAPLDDSSSPYTVNGKVGRQSVDSIHDYSRAYGLTVSAVSDSDAYDVTTYLYNQKGEDYYTLTSKTSTTKWYCSKLPYRAYYTEASKTLDYDAGYYVLPDDIYMDRDVSTFATGL